MPVASQYDTTRETNTLECYWRRSTEGTPYDTKQDNGDLT